MALYLYRCEQHGQVEIRHAMAAVGLAQVCPECGQPVKRVITPQHHRWPSNHRPGFEDSGQRMFLDPEFQAREADKLAQMKDEHLAREAKKA